jgi:hypothetical protein
MQLDRARIAIHDRRWSDNLDLALHVIGRHAAPLAICAMLGITLPALANHTLLAPFAADEFRDSLAGVYYWLVIFVLIEAPLATALVTIYLGQALFIEHPTARSTAGTFVSCLPQMLLLQFVVRASLILPIVSWIVPFGFWPYLSEIILLERNPLVSRGGRLSTLKRSALLHRGNSSQFMLEGLGTLCVAGLLTLSLALTGNFLAENLFGVELGGEGRLVVAQLSLWLVVMFFTVARFLNYLNQRIRNEGWEVELLLKAERDRLQRHLA